jgi:hypothetical protein
MKKQYGFTDDEKKRLNASGFSEVFGRCYEFITDDNESIIRIIADKDCFSFTVNGDSFGILKRVYKTFKDFNALIKAAEKAIMTYYKYREGIDKESSLWTKLENRLKNFDWYYEYSDDGRVWRAGVAAEQEIEKLMSDASKINAEKANELYNKYSPKKVNRVV